MGVGTCTLATLCRRCVLLSYQSGPATQAAEDLNAYDRLQSVERSSRSILPAMPLRFTGTPPNYPLAFMLAPGAGAVSAAILALLVVVFSPMDPSFRASELAALAAAVAAYAFIICAGFTLVVGAGVAAFVRVSHRVPSLTVALAVGALAAVLPFATAAAMNRSGSSAQLTFESLGMPLFAIAVSVPTACSFWYLGLRNRPG